MSNLSEIEYCKVNISQGFHINLFSGSSFIDFNFNVIHLIMPMKKFTFTIFTSIYFNTAFDGYNLFPLNLILISSESTFLGDLKITSSGAAFPISESVYLVI